MRSCTEPYYLHLVMEVRLKHKISYFSQLCGLCEIICMHFGFQYLLHLGFQETVSVFKKECNVNGFAVPNHNDTGNSKKNRILKSFDLAQRALFFQASVVFPFPLSHLTLNQIYLSPTFLFCFSTLLESFCTYT